MEVMDADKDVCSVAVVQFDHLLGFAVHRRGDESAEFGYSVVGVYDIVAYL